MDGENNKKENNDVNDHIETGAADVQAEVKAEYETEEEAETKSRIPHVDNIENIEKIEITENIVNQFMTYFPHLVVGSISILVLLGMGFIASRRKIRQSNG